MNCNACGKKYTRKHSLEKHSILCQFQLKTKREKLIDNEETRDIPTYQELINIVQELSIKQEKMERQMQEFQKWTQKERRKMNVLEWLNENITPTNDFHSWLQQISINENYFTCLMEENTIEVVQQILTDHIPKDSTTIYPLQSFSQKNGIIYIFINDAQQKWLEITNTMFIKLLQHIQSLFLKKLIAWKEIHKQEMLEKDELSILYNKMIIKLMDIPLVKNSHYTRIQNMLFNYLKKDLKSLIEYEFE